MKLSKVVRLIDVQKDKFKKLTEHVQHAQITSIQIKNLDHVFRKHVIQKLNI